MLRKVINLKEGLKLTCGARARSVVTMEIVRTWHGRMAEENRERSRRGVKGSSRDLRRLSVAPGNRRKERPRRGEENHPDATRDARAKWTEGARAQMIGRASTPCGVARGRHRTISWAVMLARLTHVRGLTRRVDPAGRSRASGELTQKMALKRSGGVLAYVS